MTDAVGRRQNIILYCSHLIIANRLPLDFKWYYRMSRPTDGPAAIGTTVFSHTGRHLRPRHDCAFLISRSLPPPQPQRTTELHIYTRTQAHTNVSVSHTDTHTHTRANHNEYCCPLLWLCVAVFRFHYSSESHNTRT